VKKIVVALILALSLLLLAPAASAAGIQIVDRAGDGVWTDDTWQVEIYPGERKATTISLRNSSSSSLDVEVTITPDSFNGNLTFELDRATFAMPGKSYTDVTLTVRASGGATPGIYTTELRIKSEVAPSEDDGVSKLRLYNLRVESITQDSTDILWKTNRTSTSQVTYWSSPGLTVKDKSYVREHLVHLEDLKDDTTYYFEIVSRDRHGLKASDKGEFTTLKTRKPKPRPTPTPTPSPTPTPIPPAPVPPPIPPPTPEKPTPWGLIGGIVGGLAVAGGIGYWLWRRLKGGK